MTPHGCGGDEGAENRPQEGVSRCRITEELTDREFDAGGAEGRQDTDEEGVLHMKRWRKTDKLWAAALVPLVAWHVWLAVKDFLSSDAKTNIMAIGVTVAMLMLLEVGERCTFPRWVSVILALLFGAGIGSLYRSVEVGVYFFFVPCVVLWNFWGRKRSQKPQGQDRGESPT